MLRKISFNLTTFSIIVILTLTVAHAEERQAASEKKVVKPGDTVELRYACTLKNGEVVASTGKLPETEKRSSIYVPPKNSGDSTSLTVPRSERTCPSAKAGSFESEIEKRLLLKIIGREEGEKLRIELDSEGAPANEGPEGIVNVTRVRTRPKIMKMPVGDYEFRARKKPEVGQDFAIDPAFPGKVESVSENEVVIRFTGKPGETIHTPFGKGKVREEEDHYKVEIDAKVGDLVRTGRRVGRIIHVGEKILTIDYRHPFGFETLVCDVTVERIERSDSKPQETSSIRSIQGAGDETPSL